jgi:hypothetical protein
MTRKTWFLLSFALFLGSLYLYYFTDWLNPPRIQIIKSDRVLRQLRPGQAVYPVAFLLNGKYHLTTVRVYAADDLAVRKKNPQPLWDLKPAKKSGPPIKGFIYGRPIPGMQPATTNRWARPLEPGTKYHLLVQAGRAKGEMDFQATAADTSAQ